MRLRPPGTHKSLTRVGNDPANRPQRRNCEAVSVSRRAAGNGHRPEATATGCATTAGWQCGPVPFITAKEESRLTTANRHRLGHPVPRSHKAIDMSTAETTVAPESRQSVLCPLSGHNPDCMGAGPAVPSFEYAVVCLRVEVGDFPENWMPHGPGSLPPLSTDKIPALMLVPLAAEYNRTNPNKRKNRWACLLVDAGMILVHCPLDVRPTDPSAFPPGTVVVSSLSDARQRAFELNRPITVAARCPRLWYAAAVREVAHVA